MLLDVRMPGMSGIDAARKIAAVRPDAVVVLVSSWADVDLPADAKRCGAAASLPKRNLKPSVLAELWRRHGRPGADIGTR